MTHPGKIAAALGAALAAGAALAEPAYKAEVPATITTPDEVRTRLGTLRFSDGAPDAETVRTVYDNLDFMRGVEAFLNGIPMASIHAVCHGLAEAGLGAQSVGLFEELMDARSVYLTPNSTTMYVMRCFDLTDGPVVFDAPPGVLGPLDDAYFRWVTDVGATGPDEGRGGKYLLVGPDYQGELPEEGYFIARSQTNNNLLFFRAFVKDGDLAATAKGVKDNTRVYPWAMRDNPPATDFVNLSGRRMNTVHANTYEFYEEINEAIQKEPADAFPPEFLGILAGIGIKKGQPFEPDARMKAILTEAVAVGNATARSIVYDQRDRRGFFFDDRQWMVGFVGGSYLFEDEGERMLDARTLMHYYATGVTPAMAAKMVGSGSQYAYAVRDSEGRYLDGGKTYRINLPAPIPVNNFWSFMVYDNQTRSMLETDQKLAGIDSNNPDLKPNADGSYTVWFGPRAPEGHESNWVQTMPGKGWNTLLRLYGPLEPWFDGSWKPGDFELVE